MDYLKEEFEKYKKVRQEGKTFEYVDPLKVHAFGSLYKQIIYLLQKPLNILEVGFGSGYFLAILAKQGHKVHGIEIAPYTLEYAQKIFEEKQVKGILRMGNGFSIDYPDNYFDLVLNVGTIEHFEENEQKKFVGEMTRVSNNLILLSTSNDCPESLYQVFKKSIFYKAEIENIPNLTNLCLSVGINPLFESGFHVISRDGMCPNKLRQLYNNKKLNLPRKEYTPLDLEELSKAESKFSREELRENAFLKYVIGKKV